MAEFALMKNGAIVKVVTTFRTQTEIQKMHPDCEVADLYSLPKHVQENYQYFRDRPGFDE